MLHDFICEEFFRRRQQTNSGFPSLAFQALRGWIEELSECFVVQWFHFASYECMYIYLMAFRWKWHAISQASWIDVSACCKRPLNCSVTIKRFCMLQKAPQLLCHHQTFLRVAKGARHTPHCCAAALKCDSLFWPNLCDCPPAARALETQHTSNCFRQNRCRYCVCSFILAATPPKWRCKRTDHISSTTR